jgi:fructokinase
VTTASPFPVVCAGEILIDLIAPAGETLETATEFAIREGGAPMNAAVALARLGVPVRFCGVTGADGFGARLRALLEQEGVDTTALRAATSEPTSIAYAWRDACGDGQFQLVRMADRLLAGVDIDRADVTQASALLVGSVALAATPSNGTIVAAVARASAAGVPVVFDVNARPSLWPDADALRRSAEPVLLRTNVLKVSMDDARFLWEAPDPEAVLEICKPYPISLVVITDGARGVAVGDPATGDIRHYPVFPVEAVDPTGAGDAFTAALLSRLLASGWLEPDDDDVWFAMAAGALATTRVGALAALPTRDDITRFLAEQV